MSAREPFVYRGVRFAPMQRAALGCYWGIDNGFGFADLSKIKFRTKAECKRWANFLKRKDK